MSITIAQRHVVMAAPYRLGAPRAS
jgi:hypothetical protein